MKPISIHPLFALFIFALPANGAVVELFNFSDAAGTGLANTANTGTVGTAWNFNVNGQPGEAATDGNGILWIGANATAGSSTISSDYTRKVTFATTITDGDFMFEYRLASWNLDDTGALNAAHDQEGITIRLNTGAGDSLSLITALNATSANVRARHSGAGLVTATAGQTNIGFTGSDLVVRVSGNLTTGAFTTSYNPGGAGFTNIITDGAGLVDIKEIVMFIEGGTAGWSSTDSAGIDYISLTAIPEPSAALLGGLGLLALLRRRR
jgi:hypothetical protein